MGIDFLSPVIEASKREMREGDYVEAGQTGAGEWQLPQITASASEKDGKTTVTLANLSADRAETVTLRGVSAKEAAGRVLNGKIDQYNDFDASPLAIQPLTGIRVEKDAVTVTLPACAVAQITLQ